MFRPILIYLTALPLCFSDQSKYAVDQSPRDIIVKDPVKEVTINCKHSNSDFNMILWYRRTPGHTDMALVGYARYTSLVVEEKFKNSFNVSGSGSSGSGSSLHVLTPSAASDSAVFFCAATGQNYDQPAYFGEGTKLTVLGTGLIPTKPTVKIYPPSKRERPRNKHDHKFKTLVCVASDFYPDHVKVSWKVNGEPCNERVSTDLIAQKVGSTYTISSRLVVDEDKWTNSENYFNCVVNFYDGNAYTDYTATVWGIDGDKVKEEGGMSRGTYMKITQHAKLSYVVFIVKGVVYGLFVAFLLWKIQRTNGKQT